MSKSLAKQASLGSGLFSYERVHARAAYLKLYGKFPNTIELYQVSTDKIYKQIKSDYKKQVIDEVKTTEIYANSKDSERTYCLFILEQEVLVELGTDYCEIYYSAEQSDFVQQLKKSFIKCKVVKRKPLEINLISTNEEGLSLNSMEVKRTKLDLSLYYEDDFLEVDQLIQKRLNKKKDKGIVLLHGMPGTGKTTYIRYLVGKLKKKILFIPPNIAGRIANPELIKLLINNPDSILIIEDAESIIMQRQAGETSSVSNLLNISDGLLSDFLNVQIICTFNSAISSVDEALLRKGRLIAKYEFKKLSVAKAQHLSDHKGFDQKIDAPMSIAEILNPYEQDNNKQKVAIGFRAQWQNNQ